MAQQIFDRPRAFSLAQCDALIALAAERGAEPAPVYGGHGAIVNPLMRSAATVLIAPGEAPDWLVARIDALFAEGAVALEIEVGPLFEPLQIVRYGEGDHFQMWHSDAGTDLYERRRLSMSVELSDPADYAGGLLEIAPARMLPTGSPGRGHATVFPSRMLHRVTPVTRGTRYALVAWTGLNPA